MIIKNLPIIWTSFFSQLEWGNFLNNYLNLDKTFRIGKIKYLGKSLYKDENQSISEWLYKN